MVINKNKHPKVSIIIPTYNMEAYLLQCLESVSSQTYKDFECIIIVDGSKDNSFEIAKCFCKSHANFSVYWQDNAGSGPARNNGISRSTGDLLMFIDPDDWIDEDYVEKLVSYQEEGDFDLVTSAGKTYTYDESGKIGNISQNYIADEVIIGVNNVRQNYSRLLVESRLGGPHRKVYKASIVKTNNIQFPSLRRSQDIVFNYRYYNFVKSIRVAKYHGYNYRAAVNTYPKFRKEYIDTIKLMYNDTKEMHEKWGVSISNGLLASYFMLYIMNYIESAIRAGIDYKSLLSDTSIQEIINTSKSRKVYINIASSLIQLRFYFLLECYLKLIPVLKKYCQR